MSSPSAPPAPADETPPALPGPMSVASWDPAAVQWIKDQEHLRLLSICHYVVGGLAILFSSLFVIHILFGSLILNSSRLFAPPSSPVGNLASPTPAASPDEAAVTPSKFPSPTPAPSRQRGAHGDAPPAFLGYVLIGIGSVFVLLGWTFGALLAYSGRCLARRRRRVFSMVIAGVSCLQVPLGTILGVFTLTVLQRPTVRALYNAAAAGPTGSPALHA